jgi:hypothetical protein
MNPVTRSARAARRAGASYRGHGAMATCDGAGLAPESLGSLAWREPPRWSGCARSKSIQDWPGITGP